MRVFLAIELASIAPAVESVTRVLRAVVSGLEPGADRLVSWSRARPPHVTLHFLGEQPDERVAALTRACDAPWPAAPFAATFGGIGTFPRTGPVRVLWLGCRDGAEALAALHAEALDRLRGLGFAIQAGPFTPHVTLGRIRDRAPRGLRECLAGEGLRGVSSCAIEAVTLFASRLASSGPSYEVLARGRLSS